MQNVFAYFVFLENIWHRFAHRTGSASQRLRGSGHVAMQPCCHVAMESHRGTEGEVVGSKQCLFLALRRHFCLTEPKVDWPSSLQSLLPQCCRCRQCVAIWILLLLLVLLPVGRGTGDPLRGAEHGMWRSAHGACGNLTPPCHLPPFF